MRIVRRQIQRGSGHPAPLHVPPSCGRYPPDRATAESSTPVGAHLETPRHNGAAAPCMPIQSASREARLAAEALRRRDLAEGPANTSVHLRPFLLPWFATPAGATACDADRSTHAASRIRPR